MRRVAIGLVLCALGVGPGSAQTVLGRPNAAGEQGQQDQRPSAHQSESKTSDEAPPPSQSGHEPAEAGGHDEKQYESGISSGLIWAKGALTRFIEFAERNDKAIVAIGTIFIAAFTVILGFATIFLWRATVSLVSGADETAKRQIRAYVGLDRAYITEFRAGHKVVGQFYIKNYGLSPANECRICLAVLAIDDEDVEDFVVNYPPIQNVRPSVIFPGAEQEINFAIGGTISNENFLLFQSGDVKVIIRGFVQYVDTFGRKQTTEISMFATSGMMTFLFAKTGNHAS